MTIRSLDSLAHALGAATTLDAALGVLRGGVADVGRGATVAFPHADDRAAMSEDFGAR